MKIDQRPYQTKGLKEIVTAIAKGETRILYVLPTGAGKTVVAGMVAQAFDEEDKRILFLVHRRELVKQAYATLSEALPKATIGQLTSHVKSNVDAPILVASVQSLSRRNWETPNYIFIDEAHHVRARTWEKLLARWPDAVKIGLTATPERLDGKGLHAEFDVMIQGPSIKALQDDDYLAKVKTLVPSRREVIEWRKNTAKATFAHAVKAWKKYAKGKRTIFFGWNVEHSREVAQLFRDSRISAEHVDGKTPEDVRDKMMERFRQGKLKVICNFDIISEGFDAPDCDCIIIGGSTASIVRYLQRAGRVMRPGDNNQALILDMAGVSYYNGFGTVERERKWSLADGAVKPDTNKFLPFEPEDIRRDRKPYQMVECEMVPFSESGDEFYFMEDVCSLLQCRRSLIYSRMSSGQFPESYRQGKSRIHFWERSVIDRFLKDKESRNPNEFYTMDDICSLFQLTDQVIKSRMRRGLFPKSYKIGEYTSRHLWERSVIDNFLKSEKLYDPKRHYTMDDICSLFNKKRTLIFQAMQRGLFPKSYQDYKRSTHLWERSVIDKFFESQSSCDGMFSRFEVAKILNLSLLCIFKKVRDGKLKPPTYKMGGGTSVGEPYWDKDYILKIRDLNNSFREEYFDAKSLANYFGISTLALQGGVQDGRYPKPCLRRNSLGKPGIKNWWKKSKIKKIYDGKWIVNRHRFLITKEFADVLEIKEGTLHFKMKSKYIPEPTIISGSQNNKNNMWDTETVRTWLTKHRPDRLPALEALLKSRQAEAERTQPCT